MNTHACVLLMLMFLRSNNAAKLFLQWKLIDSNETLSCSEKLKLLLVLGHLQVREGYDLELLILWNDYRNFSL